MHGSRKCGIYTMEFNPAIRNSDMWCEDKCIQLEGTMLSEMSQTQKHKGCHVFSHPWKINPKDKHIHKTKPDHTQTQMWNMSVTV
jgi:hypothetical protein